MDSASDVAFTTLTADVRAVAPSIDAETISTYVGLLERMFVVEAQQPWASPLRSRARLRTAAKLHLVDPALAAAALGAGASQLRGDLATLGLLFESAVVHDLAVLAAAHGGEVRHYRDSNGKEIDATPAPSSRSTTAPSPAHSGRSHPEERRENLPPATIGQ